jgi:hypothetical protein
MEDAMSTSELPARRRDEFSDWHDLTPATCRDCGCQQFLAKDDPAIVWEPGLAWDETCSDRSCHCHEQPLLGQRRD